MKRIVLLFLLLLFIQQMYAQQDINIEEIRQQIEEILPKLTLEEKASLCSGRDDWSTQPIERLNIPWIWVADGPHGLRRAPKTNMAGYGDQLPATCFPTASALASSWDLDLVHKVGQALGDECQALDVNVLLGPGVNIKRSVLGGRNFEYYSEDPVLSGEMGAAFINGVQSRGVGTSLKHFVANNVETMRMYMNSDVDDRTLHEIYLKPFEIAVKKAQPWTIMACYNRVQGEYGTQNPFLLTEKLKEEWGFEGIVISDWFAVVDRVAALKAGMHIEMPHVSTVNDELLVKAVRSGELDEKLIDNLVREILFIVFRAKALEKENFDFDREEHHAFARRVSSETITLLKNDNKILPVTKDSYKKIAVIGEFAKNPRFQGNGSSEVKPTKLDNAWQVMQDEYGEQFELAYAQGYDLKNDDDFSHIEDAVKLAAESDIVLLFAGLPLHYESEGIDRKHIMMPQAHNQLIKELSYANKNLVVILTNGSAVSMPWVDQVPGLVEAWLGGQAGAGAAVDILFGKVNPSGKLTETFPVKLEDTPSFFNFPGENGEVLYGERIFVGYRYFDEKKIEPLFPFGYGLSYTDFEYGNLKLSKAEITDKEEVELSLKVKNTGNVIGKEVVQIYVSDLISGLQRPEKELKRFAKVELLPGEEKEISFKLDAQDLAYYDPRYESWVFESGEFTISAAASSRDIRSIGKLTLRSDQELTLPFDEYTFFREYWNYKPTRELLKEMLPEWISAFVPEGKSIDEAIFHDFFIDHPMIKFPYISNGEISMDQVMELVEKSKKMTIKK